MDGNADTDILLRFRGREITRSDVRFVRELIAEHPEASRCRLSILLCEAWDWRQANGRLRDMVCRSLMLELHRANSRFLILPWVRVPHLASHLLGRMVQRLAADWSAVYGHPVHFLETFVDTSRFLGTCYLAANWIRLGTTTGRGTKAKSYWPTVPVKLALGYPLHRRFRELLGAAS